MGFIKLTQPDESSIAINIMAISAVEELPQGGCKIQVIKEVYTVTEAFYYILEEIENSEEEIY